MTRILIVVDSSKDWAPYYPTENLVSVRDYLARVDAPNTPKTQVINLCRSYRYLSNGYYCSLLAEARDHKVIPSVRVINDLGNKALYSLDLTNLDKALDKAISASAEGGEFALKIFFGSCGDPALEPLARQIFEALPCPILEVSFVHQEAWAIKSVRAGSLERLTDAEQDVFAAALDAFSTRIWRRPRQRKRYRYDLAMLVDPDEALPPSNKAALRKFIRAGRQLGIAVEPVERKDYVRLAEYDGLFIRETTAINDHTYRFAKRAEHEGMVVIDDPMSILRCTNKIYLADLLKSNQIPTPRTLIVSRRDVADAAAIGAQLGFPVVLKIPDGSFSRGVVRADDEHGLAERMNELLKHSALLIAQEFIYTDYDWRIGVLNQKPIFACQYFMSRGHWQIYKHGHDDRVESGGFKAVPVYEVPKPVVRTAVKAANLIGNGLYGVDLKQTNGQAIVIEVNDNPNVDSGIEDKVLGDDLYRIILEEFVRRLERKRMGL